MIQTFFQLIKRYGFLPTEFRYVVDSFLQRNCFFAHSENFILSLLADEDHDIRIKVLEILKLAAESCPNLRKFELPKVNFAAEIFFVNYSTLLLCDIVASKQIMARSANLKYVCF